MHDSYRKVDFFYIDLGLVVTDIYGVSCSGLCMIYATVDNLIIGYTLLNQKPLFPSLTLLKLQISENVKDIRTWVQNPISYNPLFKTSPYFSNIQGLNVSIEISNKSSNMMLKAGSDKLLDEILDIPSEYLSPLLGVWVFTPRLALQLVRDQIKRNYCLVVEDAKRQL